jgi:hypothetical protein
VNLFQWEEAAIAELKKELAEKSRSGKESRRKAAAEDDKAGDDKTADKAADKPEKKTGGKRKRAVGIAR